MWHKLKTTLGSLGPGFIIASLVLGPGSITIASRIGSEFAYRFLWVVPVALVFMLNYTSMSARFGIVSGSSLLQVIALQYGRFFSVLIGVSAFLAASSYQFGNNAGIAIGMEGITGIRANVWPLVFTPAAILLTLFARDLYRVLERFMMVLILVIIVSFLISLVLSRPEISGVARGFVPGNIQKENLDSIIALMATTFSLVGAFYQSYLVHEKGWKKEHFRKSLSDTRAGIIILAGITLTLIINSAASLHPEGVVVNSVADMAAVVESLFGRHALYIFCIGLIAAAFSSLMANALIGGGLISDGLGLGRSMNNRPARFFTLFILVTGMIMAVFFKGNVIYAIILAQASSILAVPLIAVAMLLVANNREIMGDRKNNLVQNLVAILGLAAVAAMVFLMIRHIIDYLDKL